MGRVLAFGLSPFLIIATDSVLLIVLNTVLQRYGGPGLGDTLVTCATIVQSYLLIITMPMGGMTLGTQPVISFNFGAGKPERIRQAMKAIVCLCLLFCGIMTLATYTVSPLFVRLFTSDGEIAARSVRYIKIFTCMILPLAVQYPLVDGPPLLDRCAGPSSALSSARAYFWPVCSCCPSSSAQRPPSSLSLSQTWWRPLSPPFCSSGVSPACWPTAPPAAHVSSVPEEGLIPQNYLCTLQNRVHRYRRIPYDNALSYLSLFHFNASFHKSERHLIRV